MDRDSCITRVGAGVILGNAVGAVAGAAYGAVDAVRLKLPGFLKTGHIFKTASRSAAVCGLLVGAGSLMQCGES